MSGHFILSCDCQRCVEIGPATHRWTKGYDISSARSVARSETLSDEQRWTGDGDYDFAPGHEQADLDGTNREFVRVEERAQFIRTTSLARYPLMGSVPRTCWAALHESDKEHYREWARNELQAERKRVRGLG